MPDPPVQQAFRGFKERYSHVVGVQSIERGFHEREPCLVALVDPGFGSDRLPAAFFGLRIRLNGGGHVYPATGDPV